MQPLGGKTPVPPCVRPCGELFPTSAPARLDVLMTGLDARWDWDMMSPCTSFFLFRAWLLTADTPPSEYK